MTLVGKQTVKLSTFNTRQRSVIYRFDTLYTILETVCVTLHKSVRWFYHVFSFYNVR